MAALLAPQVNGRLIAFCEECWPKCLPGVPFRFETTLPIEQVIHPEKVHH
jgi:hypothetical protein